MIIIVDCPENTTCVGVFINYKTEQNIADGCFTTTNALIDCEKYNGVKIENDGTLVFKKRRTER